ncbi:MAG: DUF3025 domain-containing protein [Comamonadaceae bacterium]|nr:DUF3025 domain-containing protein [Comamonadaceae bacterium]
MVTQALQINWNAPWWEPVRSLGQPALASWMAGAGVAHALNAFGPAPVSFLPHAALAEGQAYERFIFERRAVPTRDNLHDFLNGLMWLRYPLSKRRMNALQAQEIAVNGVQATRGPVRDAVTVFDENGALLAAPEPLMSALRERRWDELFGPMRPLWEQARLWLLGHAALEKLVSPYKSITAHVLAVPEELRTPEEADEWLADWLSAERLVPKPFVPLPLLGIPGWWAENEEAGFYDDKAVFRPKTVFRPKRAAMTGSAACSAVRQKAL